MDRQGRTWFRRFPVGLLIALVGMGLWLWRSDTASAAERVWVFSAFVSAVFCVWGYAEARRTKGWVTDQQQTHPRRDYAGARIVAQTHYVTHIILLLAQLAFLQFGIFAALTAPARPGQPLTLVGLNLTLTLIFVQGMLTGLNVWLVWRRRVLVRAVVAIGGD